MGNLRFPQDSVKLQKLLDQFRRYTNRRHADEDKWSPELRAYVVAQAVGPMGIDNEALATFHFHERRFSNATPAQPMPSFPPFKAESVTYCAHCQSKVHDGKGCIVRLLHVSMQIGLKLVNRCGFIPDWKTASDSRNLEALPHVGPLLAQCAPYLSQAYRERMPDTLLLFRSTERLGIHYLSDYSATHCKYSSLRMTNRPAFKGTILHRTDGLVEPRCNTTQGGQWRYT